MAVTLLDYITIESNELKRRYRNNRHVVFKYRHNIAITLPPEIEDRLGLLPGLDCAMAALEGNRVVLTFHRLGANET